MEPVCFDIMEMIGEQYKIIKETNKNKKIYGEIIKHLDYYIDYYVDPEDNDEAQEILTNNLFYKQDLLEEHFIDTKFLDYENLWDTNHYKIICHKHGGQEHYDEWCNECWFYIDEDDE